MPRKLTYTSEEGSDYAGKVRPGYVCEKSAISQKRAHTGTLKTLIITDLLRTGKTGPSVALTGLDRCSLLRLSTQSDEVTGQPHFARSRQLWGVDEIN